jgi:hypothetical protein
LPIYPSDWRQAKHASQAIMSSGVEASHSL